MVTIKKMNVTANYRKISRAKCAIIGMSCLFLWGCSKVDLKMGLNTDSVTNASQGSVNPNPENADNKILQDAIKIAEKCSRVVDLIHCAMPRRLGFQNFLNSYKLFNNNNPPLLLGKIVKGGKYVCLGAAAVGCALFISQISGEPARHQSCIQLCHPGLNNSDKDASIRVRALFNLYVCASQCGKETISVLLPGIISVTAIVGATVCNLIEGTWYRATVELDILNLKIKILQLKTASLIKSLEDDNKKRENNTENIVGEDAVNAIRRLCNRLHDLWEYVQRSMPTLSNEEMLRTFSELKGKLDSFYTKHVVGKQDVDDQKAWELLLKNLVSDLQGLGKKKPNETGKLLTV